MLQITQINAESIFSFIGLVFSRHTHSPVFLIIRTDQTTDLF
jgi:hypothetical protein